MGQRRVRDFYPTPEWATRELLARYPQINGLILEPCAGEGHISNELARAGLDVITNDIDRRFAVDTYSDATREESWPFGTCDWIVTNPPFDTALVITELAIRAARVGVAMLLRVTFSEPTETGTPVKRLKDGRVLPATRPRAPFLEQFPPTGFHPLPRMSFTGDGKTDSATCAWFVWEKDLIGRVKAVDVIREPGARGTDKRAPARLERGGETERGRSDALGVGAPLSV